MTFTVHDRTEYPELGRQSILFKEGRLEERLFAGAVGRAELGQPEVDLAIVPSFMGHLNHAQRGVEVQGLTALERQRLRSHGIRNSELISGLGSNPKRRAEV